MPPSGPEPSQRDENRPESGLESGRVGQLVGFLDVGDDFVRFPHAARRDGAQADGPVGTAGAGCADDVELDRPAQRMPLQGVEDPGPELVDRSWGLGKERFEIHVASPSLTDRPAMAAGYPVGLLLGLAWLTAR